MKKYVYAFEENKSTPETIMLLGNKGAQLAEMSNAGIPVPPGFTVTTEACNEYYKIGKKWPEGLEEQVREKLEELEKKINKKLGTGKNPLFVSVRSGSYVSMPGMMDTVLNLGMNDKSVEAFSEATGNERAAWDSYRRFVQMFGDVVMGVEHASFEKILSSKKKEERLKDDTELSSADLKDIVKKYKKLINSETGKDFPQEPWKQLKYAINAVFGSWNNNRAVKYRRINKLRNDAGTGVNVQAMVFGNMGNDSATGVGFTRNPATGEKQPYGEWLINAQGEDVVAGIRTPRPLDELKKVMPSVYEQLIKYVETLEKHYKELQDYEFTIEKGKLYILQTRGGKRTGTAAVKIAVDMVSEGLINEKTAVTRVKPEQLDSLLHKRIDEKAKSEDKVIARGLPASPGAAVGHIVFTAEDAAEKKSDKYQVILVRQETSPEDIEGMDAAQGVLTSTGGMTCLAGDSTILTNKGFITSEKAYEMLKDGEKTFILSFDSKSGKTVWKKIIATGKRLSKVIEISTSQTGHSTRNTLKVTPDHKMIIINTCDMIKKPLENILKDNNFVSVIDKIPFLNDSLNCPKLSYLAGAIFTDGCIQLKRTKGRVTFTQKPTEEKQEFIDTVDSYFNDIFDSEFTRRMKFSSGYLRGRQIQGEALDLICSRREPAEILTKLSQNIDPWIIALDEESSLNFLAGVIDGDGSFYNNRIQIYASKEHVAHGVVLACLKLGIVPQVTVNRNIYNIQIVERISDILKYTKRVKGDVNKKILGTKLFSVKQLFEDIADDVNFMGRVNEGVKRNIMFDSKKIERNILPLCKQKDRIKLSKILDSDIRNYRIKKTADLGKTWVYNFEVDSDNEMDKNFIVFTKMFTPLLVSNSHAAVVMRGMGKCCVAGAGDVIINEKSKTFRVSKDGKEVKVKEGDIITLDGSTGEVFLGAMPTVDPEISGDFKTLMKWSDKYRKIKVRANADTPKDAQIALEFGAEGIGLCRTEHMFFEGERIKAVREMLLAENKEGRQKALDKLLPMQRKDFEGIFKVMDGKPVIIRLLDPPLHEFLPKTNEDMEALAKDMNVSVEKIKELKESMHEFNPMLGFRGCRLGVLYPEINKMQIKAIFEAAIMVNNNGKKALPEIEVPLVGNVNEFLMIKSLVDEVVREMGINKDGAKVDYKVGTMIEVPRAAVTADEIAKHADFLSFGTNDLTQMTLGFSRDDAGKFIPKYIEEGIFVSDPFQTIDQNGVGNLMKMCVEKARSAKKGIDIGICGEHGGEPESVKFCHRIGLSNVSCSPYRVPIARLAAAQASIEDGK